jgi:hypothetical protein
VITNLDNGDLDGLVALTNLTLLSNQISMIGENVFDGTPSLTMLNINNNRICITNLSQALLGYLNDKT